MMRWAAVLLSLALALALATPAAAHNGVVHKNAAEASAHREAERARAAALPVTPDALFPKGLGGAYRLTDQFGAERDQSDPDGRPQLVFFGYASCEAICSVAMPSVAEAVTLLERDGVLATPVLITVDPAHDTPPAMRPALAKVHERYIGLTGSEAALAEARKAFQVESKQVSRTPDSAPIYAHGSFIYLVDGEGAFLTLMPPILSAERIAEIVKGYLTAKKVVAG